MFLLKLEMDKYSPEVFIVLLEAMVKFFDVPLIQKTQDFLLELAAAFAGDDLDQLYFLVDGFFHNAIQLCFDLVAAVIDIV